MCFRCVCLAKTIFAKNHFAIYTKPIYEYKITIVFICNSITAIYSRLQ